MKKNIVTCLSVLFVCLLLHHSVAAQRVRPVKINESNATAYRDTLLNLIFGSNSIPDQWLPDQVFTNVGSIDYLSGFPFASLYYPGGNLAGIDRFEISIGDNLQHFPDKAKVYLFRPHAANGKLFIYHAGHCAGTAIAEDIVANNAGNFPGRVIPRLLAQGYTVLAVPMIHYRSVPPLDYNCGYNGHNEIFTEGFYPYPMGLFFKPLVASLNHLGRNNYSAIYMLGLSGGGWAASLYPAIDSSIRVSFPVAGSWPMPVRQAFYPAIGDYEQTYPPLFSQFIDYHDLYTLSCLAPARKMLQINNRFDPCCFNGADAHIYYVDSVKRALAGTGGEFAYYLDESNANHSVSDKAMDIVMGFLNGQRGTLINEPPPVAENGGNYQYDIRGNFSASPLPSSGNLQYSLLKAPNWLTINAINGELRGNVPPGNVAAGMDTVSFKVEDPAGNYLIRDIVLTRKRDAPFLFIVDTSESICYWLPEFSHALDTIHPQAVTGFFTNNPGLTVTGIRVLNKSVVALSLNRPAEFDDEIGYLAASTSHPVTFTNGSRAASFGLTRIDRAAFRSSYAQAGMIRFNSSTRKFEFFDGTRWNNMH